MTYKSKDVEYMRTLKKAILVGMRGHMPDEKQYTWDYVRKQVTLDDLQTYAVSHLGRMVQFPTENFNSKLMIVFLKKPTGIELEIIEKMTQAAKIPKEDMYITWLHKAETNSHEEVEFLHKILDSELAIIQPKCILTMGINFTQNTHEVIDFKDAKLLATFDLNYIMSGENPEDTVLRKRDLWSDVQQLFMYYKT